MVQVIYADILFIVNVYVNYALLRITAQLLKRNTEQFRIILSSVMGGLYAFIILVPDMPFIFIVLTRLVFAFLIILVAYGYKSKKVFLRSVITFFTVSFIFAGLMYFLWTFFSPPVMAYRNSVVYFDIDTLDLCVMTIICYGFIKLFDILSKKQHIENVIYETSIYINDRTYCAKSFLDTGNSLTEPFSLYPVIVVYSGIKSIEKETESISEYIDKADIPKRFVLCKTLSDDTLLYSFRPDSVRIKGIDIDIETDEIYIALTNTKIKGGDYDALIGSAVFEGKTSETEKDYRKQTV